ncbi:hypothetical protein [Streptomyces sp. WSLK1-3]|uniref:hypothetical protein n=1 Tax=Streptomyces sp. WSLK1-3 TaxID=3375475 RepID=UPI0037A0EBFD
MKATSTRRTRWGAYAGPGAAGTAGAQGGVKEVCVSAEAHGDVVPVSPELQADRPLSSLGPCPAPEPEL